MSDADVLDRLENVFRDIILKDTTKRHVMDLGGLGTTFVYCAYDLGLMHIWRIPPDYTACNVTEKGYSVIRDRFSEIEQRLLDTFYQPSPIEWQWLP